MELPALELSATLISYGSALLRLMPSLQEICGTLPQDKVEETGADNDHLFAKNLMGLFHAALQLVAV